MAHDEYVEFSVQDNKILYQERGAQNIKYLKLIFGYLKRSRDKRLARHEFSFEINFMLKYLNCDGIKNN